MKIVKLIGLLALLFVLCTVGTTGAGAQTGPAPKSKVPDTVPINIQLSLQGRSCCGPQLAVYFHVEVVETNNGNNVWVDQTDYADSTGLSPFYYVPPNTSLSFWIKAPQWLSWRVDNVQCGSGGGCHITTPLLLAGDADIDYNVGGYGFGNDIVNILDENKIRNSYGATCGSPTYYSGADFNADCIVNLSDWNYLKSHYGLGGAPSLVCPKFPWC